VEWFSYFADAGRLFLGLAHLPLYRFRPSLAGIRPPLGLAHLPLHEGENELGVTGTTATHLNPTNSLTVLPLSEGEMGEAQRGSDSRQRGFEPIQRQMGQAQKESARVCKIGKPSKASFIP